MKTLNPKVALLILMLLGLTLPMTQCSDGAGFDESLASDNALLKSESVDEQLTEAEIHGILFMREEEKLARDVYIYLYEIFPLRPFLNISKSEQAHMDAIKYLIDTYELEALQNKKIHLSLGDRMLETLSTHPNMLKRIKQLSQY